MIHGKSQNTLSIILGVVCVVLFSFILTTQGSVSTLQKELEAQKDITTICAAAVEHSLGAVDSLWLGDVEGTFTRLEAGAPYVVACREATATQDQ